MIAWALALALVEAPLVSGPTTLTVRVRATDTGGNTVLSNALQFEVVPDTIAPVLTATTPADGEPAFGGRSIDLTFSEALDDALLPTAIA